MSSNDDYSDMPGLIPAMDTFDYSDMPGLVAINELVDYSDMPALSPAEDAFDYSDMPPLVYGSPYDKVPLHVTEFPFQSLSTELNYILQTMDPKLIEELVIHMFMIRDVQGRVGERRSFLYSMNMIAKEYPQLVASLLECIPAYGYWKDFFTVAMRNPYHHILSTALLVSYKQLLEDERQLAQGQPVSLFAKWVPKEGKSRSRFTKDLANYIYSGNDMTHSQKMAALRRRLVKLNAAANTVEILKCANRWSEIKPESVPKIALAKGLTAFMNEKISHFDYSVSLRYPDNLERMACRANFEQFMENRACKYPVAIHDTRYEPVRNKVREYFMAAAV